MAEHDVSYYIDNTIVEITDGDEGKKVKIYAYGYFAGDPEDKPYRLVEYSFFFSSLKRIKESGLSTFESAYGQNHNQNIGEYSEQDIIFAYEHYNRGRMPKIINESELSENTENGIYIVIINK